MSAFDQIREAYLGSRRLPGPLSPRALNRVSLVSIPPAAVLFASLLHMALQLKYSRGQLGFPEIAGGAPVFWQRADAAAEALIGFTFLAVALLFAAGVRNWTQSEGAWMLVIGLALAGTALALALFVTSGSAMFNRNDALMDLKTYIWQQLGATFAALSVGYFFLAYRATQPVRTLTRRRQRPAQSPSPDSTSPPT